MKIVKGPQEATLDSSFLVTAATLGNAKARSMRAGAGAFEIDDLVAAFFTFMGGHRPGEERLTDDGASVDQDIEGDRPLDWSRIGRKAMAKSRRVPAQDFMWVLKEHILCDALTGYSTRLGPLAVEAKKRNVAKRTQREKADAVERRPQEVRVFQFIQDSTTNADPNTSSRRMISSTRKMKRPKTLQR